MKSDFDKYPAYDPVARTDYTLQYCVVYLPYRISDPTLPSPLCTLLDGVLRAMTKYGLLTASFTVTISDSGDNGSRHHSPADWAQGPRLAAAVPPVAHIYAAQGPLTGPAPHTWRPLDPHEQFLA